MSKLFNCKSVAWLLAGLAAATAVAAATPAVPRALTPGAAAGPGPTLSSGAVVLRWGTVPGATRYGVGVRDLKSDRLVVSTTAAGILELVTHEYNGLLAAPHDVATIVDELATLLGDEAKRRQLGTVGRQTVVEHFDLHAGARELANLYRTVAGGQQ